MMVTRALPATADEARERLSYCNVGEERDMMLGILFALKARVDEIWEAMGMDQAIDPKPRAGLVEMPKKK